MRNEGERGRRGVIATGCDIIVARALMAISDDAGDALEDWMEGDGDGELSLNNLRIAVAAALTISIDAERASRRLG